LPSCSVNANEQMQVLDVVNELVDANEQVWAPNATNQPNVANAQMQPNVVAEENQ
jgi:hypothetical protein